jgi:hypothetical protein
MNTSPIYILDQLWTKKTGLKLNPTSLCNVKFSMDLIKLPGLLDIIRKRISLKEMKEVIVNYNLVAIVVYSLSHTHTHTHIYI